MRQKAPGYDERVPLMLAYLCVATERRANIDRKVQVLDRFGLSDAEIAKVCSCSIQSVRNARSRVKRKRKRVK